MTFYKAGGTSCTKGRGEKKGEPAIPCRTAHTSSMREASKNTTQQLGKGRGRRWGQLKKCADTWALGKAGQRCPCSGDAVALVGGSADITNHHG